MAARLPIELIDIIVRNATARTLANLSAVSRAVYSISIRPLYMSIPHMSTPRTIRCLLTLATKPKVALLVRSLSILTSSCDLAEVPDLLTHALANMTGLTFLSLQLGTLAKSSILSQTSSRLTKLVCVLASDDTYPISTFLSTQSSIVELYLVCQPDGLAGLHPEALPALQDLAAPLCLLPKLLKSHVSQLSRLSVLGTIAEIGEFVKLGATLKSAKLPGLVELVAGVDITAFRMSAEVLAGGLDLLGAQTPHLRLLRLEIHRGHLEADELEDVFLSALPAFPSLKTLVVMSQPPVRSAYIRNSPHREPIQTPPSFLSMLSSSSKPPILLSRHLPQSLKYYEAQDWPRFAPDALHDRSCHTQILGAWREVHPWLERVVFPVGVYTYANKK